MPRLVILIAAVALATSSLATPPLERVVCETVWDVPGEGDAFFLGGLLVDAGWDHDGNLCVVDYRNRDLKVFAADGTYLRTLGREGEGPGEVTDARQLILHDDGRLGLLQKFPAKVVWLEPDGDPGGALTFANRLEGEAGRGYLSLPHAVQHPGGIMGYVAVMAMTAQGPSEHHWLAPIGPDGEVDDPLWHLEVEPPGRKDGGKLHEVDMYHVWAARWAPDGHGGAWLAPERDAYRIVHLGADGRELRRLERPYEAPRRDDLGRQQAELRLERKRNPRGSVVLAETDPVVHRLRLADDGRLWVDLSLGGRGPEPGTIAEIDEWSTDGEHVARRRLIGDYDPATDQRLLLDDRHVLVLHSSAEEVRLRLLRTAASGDRKESP
ncbi:hypothetical protein GF314_09130 [bacterium]|nr:hypothetical protein [bacterium]